MFHIIHIYIHTSTLQSGCLLEAFKYLKTTNQNTWEAEGAGIVF